MKDPYLYPNTEILINKFGIENIEELNSLEADFTSSRLKDIIQNGITGDFNLEHLLKFHYTIFQDIYYWAGQTRTIDIEKPEPALGGISIEYSKFENIKSDITSTLSTMTSTTFHDLGDKSNPEYLVRIIKDAIERGSNI